MALNSFKFIISFILLFVVMLIVEAIKRASKKEFLNRVQLYILLIFSYFFIYMFDWKFCLCIVAITLATYGFGILIEKTSDDKKKKIYLAISIVLLVISLGYFKYTNFFIDTFSKIFGTSAVTLKIILPIGISFYTFSAIAYLIDIYREKYKAVINLANFSLYIAFFPKLTAGPIIRGAEMIPQIQEYKGIETDKVLEGIQIFVFGLLKKIVLADRLGVFVNDVFNSPMAFNTGTVLLAIISYSLQIYFDFSGYSDMAIGSAKILGFDFSPNFNLPYIANGISDFWRRWHISLSSWFMEYIYIPLGGSRKGKIRTYINLVLVMLISGLWHGAGFTFILWGAVHGLLTCIEKVIKNHNINIPKWFSIPITYILVSLLWVVFRADSMTNAFEMFKAAFTIHGGISQPYSWTFVGIACLLIATIMAVAKAKKENTLDKYGCFYVNGYYPLMKMSKFTSLLIFMLVCGVIVLVGYFGDVAFIYGKF